MKRYRKRFAAIITLMVIWIPTYSQDIFGKVTPQTADFMRYGEVPISMFTGKANISVPIYEINDRDFNIPIKAVYTSDGFKPKKHPGIIGLDWFLNTGGTISREVYGAPDDSNGNGMFLGGAPEFAKGFWWASEEKQYSWKELREFIDKLCNGGQASCDLPHTRDGSSYDCQPDLFLFNFLSHNGAFMINNKRRVVSNYRGYKIDFSDLGKQNSVDYPKPGLVLPSFSTIRITSPDGYVYTFGGTVEALEFSKQFKPGDAMEFLNPTILSWHLSSIKSPNGRSVKFNYLSDYLAYKGSSIWQSTKTESIPDGKNIVGGYSYSAVKNVILKSIEIEDIKLKIEFTHSVGNDRYFGGGYEDYNQATYQLDKMEVTQNGNLLHSADFTYEYRNKRRFLTGINQTGKQDYKFSYDHSFTYPNADQSGITDIWGYWMASSTQIGAGLLNKVVYPAKGYTQLYYESHKYGRRVETQMDMQGSIDRIKPRLADLFAYAGGVRLRKMENYSQEGIKTSEKEYFYIKGYTPDIKEESEPPIIKEEPGDEPDDFENSDGSPTLPLLPKPPFKPEEIKPQTISSGILYQYPPFFKVNKKEIFVVSNPWINNYNIEESHIGYSQVAEKNSDGSYTIYKYSDYESHPDFTGEFYYKSESEMSALQYVAYNVTRLASNSFQRGRLVESASYNTERKIVKQEFLSYYNPYTSDFISNTETETPDDENTVFSFRVTPAMKATPGFGLLGRKIYIKSSQVEFKSLIVDGIEQTENFEYNNYDLLSKKLVSSDKGNRLEYSYKYPTDFLNTDIYNIMTLDNRISPVIEEVCKLVGSAKQTEISRTKYNYKKNPVFYKAQNLRFREFPVRAVVEESFSGNAFRTKLQYDLFDYNGNPLQSTAPDGTKTCYIWSYNGLYPIAEILNTSYDQVEKAVSAVFGMASDILSKTTVPDEAKLKKLYLNEYLSTAYVSTYTYKPLVGMLTATDARGVITYYTYDTAGRLTETYIIENGIKKTIESYNYNYRTN